jgi:hypothetical protein
MKKIILPVVVLLLFGVIGCKTNSSSDPRGVLMSFMDALTKKYIYGAKKYYTKYIDGILGMIQMGMSMAPDSVKDKTYDKNNMEFGEAKIEGDKATVPVKDKKSGEMMTYTLKKEGGAWKVAFDKTTMMEMGKEKMREKGMDINDMNNGMDSASKMLQDMKGRMDSSASTDTSH